MTCRNSIRLHRNMLFPLKMAQEGDDHSVIIEKVNVQSLTSETG